MNSTARRVAFVAAWAFVAFAIGRMAIDTSMLRNLISAAAVFAIAAFVLREPVRALFVLMLWLALVGTTRRVFTGLDNFTETADPLLIVAPAVLILLAAVALNAGAARHRTPFTTAVIGLTAVLTLSGVNPFQGNLFIGLTGVAVVVTPMLAFLIGRALLDRTDLSRLVGFAAVLAVLAALYGIYQTNVGFPSWDERWIDEQGYVALRIANDIARPFASFASGQAFGTFVAAGFVITVAYYRRLLLAVSVPALAVLGLGVVYSGGRTVLVFLVGALGLMAAARAGWGPARALAMGVAVVAALPLAVQLVAPDSFSSSASGALAAHQVQGLSSPFSSDSTLTAHLSLVETGVRTAFREPIGLGVGSITSAGRFGGQSAGTEADLGNAGVAAGLLGLGLYIAVAVLGLTRTYRLASTRRTSLEIALLGIVVVTFQHWMSGGMAPISWLAWLALGWVDRETAPAVDGADEFDDADATDEPVTALAPSALPARS